MKRKFLTLLASSLLIVSFSTTILNANSQAKKVKPFLIQGKLPHFTKSIKILWDDKDLALNKEQKEKLLIIRKKTISQAKALAKKIMQLENKIVKLSNKGIKPSKLEKDVYELAKLRAKATIVHLNCLYNTRKVLTKKQLSIIE